MKPKNQYLHVFTILFLLAACQSNKSEPVTETSSELPSSPTPLPSETPLPLAPTAPVATNTPSPFITAESIDFLQPVAILDLPNSFITRIFFSPDSQSLITGDMNGEVLIWERGAWESTIHLPAQGPPSDTSNAYEAEWLWGLTALSPDGDTIITAFGENGLVTGRDRDGQDLFSFEYGEFVYALGISPNSQFLAVGGFNDNVLVYDLDSGQLAAELVSDHEYITNLVFSSDGRILLVSYERPDNVIKLWDTDVWQETASFTHAASRIDYHDVVFTPDDLEIVIATTEDIEIVFMDLSTQEVSRGVSAHNRAPYQLAFSIDGSLLASAADDFTLRLWDTSSYSGLRTIRVGHEVGTVAFSPDGTLMAFSVWGEGAQIWSISGMP